MIYASKRKPRVKQQEALDRLEGQEAFALLMAMRTGKTKVVADDFGRIFAAGDTDDLCIVAPAGVYKTWAAEDSGLVLDWPQELVERANIHVWESGTYKSKRRKSLLRSFLLSSSPRVLVMNIEALSNVEEARATLLDFCIDKRVYGAIDESTIIKSPTAERAKFMVNVARPLIRQRRILTGLVTPRSPLDLYAQFAFLDRKILGHETYRTFCSRYAITQKMEHGGRFFDVVVGYHHVEELYDRIAPYSFRVRLEDCYDMPPSDYGFLDVPLSDEQKKVYEELRLYSTAKLAEDVYVTPNAVITQILRLHQVLCGHTTDDDGNIRFIKEHRTQTLVDYLDAYDGKAIIWCSYDIDIRKIAEALTKEYGEGSVARFWGGNRSTREDEEREFKNNKDCRFMVATPSAGGRGRTWDNANLVIYYSSTNDLEHRSQSEERPKGVGKQTHITYIDMRARGTVEEKIIKALRNKWNMATIINGDNYREWLI